MLDEEQQRLLFEGGYPVLANVAKRKGCHARRLTSRAVVASAEWWAAMQATVRK